MDKETLELAQTVMKELKDALEPLKVEISPVDLEETRGIPTVLVGVPGQKMAAWVCSVVPDMAGPMLVNFIQFYMSLTPKAEGEKLEKLERFAAGANRRMMLGTLLIQEGRLDLRYVLALDPTEEMDPDHVQTTLAALTHQAAIYVKLGLGILSGELTVEQALERALTNQEEN